jgi:SAM-dependent methyltransferase
MSQFDAIGGTYQKAATELPYRTFSVDYLMRQALGDMTNLAVLDLGCGTGVHTRQLAQWGAGRVVGIDVSAGMLEVARAQPHEGAHNVDYLQRNAAHADPSGDPELDGRFDLVSSVFVLCYAATPDELIGFFTTARRSLSAAGQRFVVTTLEPGYTRDPDYYSAYGFTLTQTEDREGAPVIFDVPAPEMRTHVTAHWWSRNMYADCAAKAGFSDVAWGDTAVSDEGLAEYGRAYWEAYLASPVAAILTATA